MLTLRPEFRLRLTAVLEPFCRFNGSVLTVHLHFGASRCFRGSGLMELRCLNLCSVSGLQCLLDLCVSVLTLRWHFGAHGCLCGSGPVLCGSFRSYLADNIWGAYSALGTLGRNLERGRSLLSTLDSLPSFCAYYTMASGLCQEVFIKLTKRFGGGYPRTRSWRSRP